jgi:hypothetical protein
VLNSNDIDLIKANRAELEALRTTPVILERKALTGHDPYTGEPINTVTTENVQAVVKGFHGQVGGERLIVNGVEIQSGDVQMTFNHTINLVGVQYVIHDGKKYALVSVQPKGIGGTNRYECVARKVT